jgi:hypothetical protein
VIYPFVELPGVEPVGGHALPDRLQLRVLADQPPRTGFVWLVYACTSSVLFLHDNCHRQAKLLRHRDELALDGPLPQGVFKLYRNDR